MKNTKRSLITSLVTLLLCSAMFVGSSFAWFTDTVSNTGNRIQAGTLKVDLLMDKGSGYESIADKEGDIFKEAAVAQNSLETLWEPGKTQVVYLAVQNKGNLALKYQFYIDVLDHGLCDDGEGNSSLEYILVPGANNTYALSDNYETVKTTATSLGATIGDVMPGRTVMANDGVLDEISEKGIQNETEYFALIVHMKENAGNVYQGKDAVIDVYLTATQYASEKDGFDNPNYDAQAQYEDKVAEPIVDTIEKTVEEGKDTTYISSVTPSEETGKQTKITVPKEVVSFVAGSTSTMTVKATPTIAANQTFTISSNGAVGAIDLTVKINDEEVTEFKDSNNLPVNVKVETYVAKNLTNVSLSYGDAETWTQVATEGDVTTGKFFYDKTTGRIVYGTTHFSTFVLGADEVAYVERNNTAYLTLSDAETNTQDGDIISLIKNVSYDPTKAYYQAVWIDHDITLNMNGYSITGNFAYAPVVVQDAKLIITDTTSTNNVKIENTYSSGYAGLLLNGGANVDLSNIKITSRCSGIFAMGSNSNIAIIGNNTDIYSSSTSTSEAAIYIRYGKAIMNGGSVSSAGNAVCLYPTDNTTKTAEFTMNGGVVSGGSQSAIITSGNTKDARDTININGGTVNGFIYKPDGGTLNVSGGNFIGATCLYAKSGITNITGGSFHATGAKMPFNHNNSGASATGDAIVVESCSYPGGDPVTQIINNATIISDYGSKVACYVYDDVGDPEYPKNPTITIVSDVDYDYYKVIKQADTTEGDIKVQSWNIYDKNDQLIKTDVQKEDTFYTNSPWNDGKGTSGQKNCSLEALLIGGAGSSIATGEGMKLRCNVVLSRNITSPVTVAKGDNFYLYLCGYTITGGTISFEKNLTIYSDTNNLESLFAGGTVTKTDNGDGTFNYIYTKN